MKLEKLDPPIDVDHDHILGPLDAELTLVEYGSYSCPRCHAVHEVIEGLRSRFGERMRYMFRHRLLLGLATALALVLSNSPVGSAFQSWWNTSLGF